MDSLINNHHLFLPDLNWSHMLWLESRNKQANGHHRVLIGSSAHAVVIKIKLHSTGRDSAARNLALAAPNKVRTGKLNPHTTSVQTGDFSRTRGELLDIERCCAAEWVVRVCWTFSERWWVALGSQGKLHWVNWKGKECVAESVWKLAVKPVWQAIQHLFLTLLVR